MERTDRARPASTTLPRRVIRQNDGWCDAPQDRNYNRPVPLPYVASHEKLVRDDDAYDAIVILDCNIHPRKQFGGSAIFFHLIRKGATHTEGCVAVSHRDMRKILEVCGKRTVMKVM